MYLKSEKKYYIYIFILILLNTMVLAVYSFSSFFYPLNPWVDVNGNLTIGKCIVNGVVVYRDIFEQRGPLLYLFHALAYLIGGNSFIGIWILEVIASAIFYLSSKTILDMYERKEGMLLFPVLFLLICSSWSFGMGGSPEEFCIPLIMMSLAIIISSLKKERFGIKRFIVIGILSGAVLWIKYSMLGFYLGAVIPFIVYILKNKNFEALKNLLVGVIIGVLVVSTPVLLYFGMNHALSDLFRVYFYINMNYYPFNDSFLYKCYFALIGFISTVKGNWQYWLFTLVGFIQMIRIEKNGFIIACIIAGGMGLTLSIYAGGQNFPYYGLILSVFSAFGLLGVPKTKSVVFKGVLLTISLIIVTVPFIKTLLHYNNDRENTIQYKVARYIEPDSTLLNYQRLDQGFFLAADVVPSEYYSWSFNVLEEEVRQKQNEYIENGETDYVVAVNKDSFLSADINHLYKLVYESDGVYLFKKS